MLPWKLLTPNCCYLSKIFFKKSKIEDRYVNQYHKAPSTNGAVIFDKLVYPKYVSYTKFERSLYKLNCIKFNKLYLYYFKIHIPFHFLPKAKCLVFQDTAEADFPFFTISGRFDAPKSEVHPPVWDTGLNAVRFRHAGLEPEAHSSSVFSTHGMHLLLVMDLSWSPHANSGVVRPCQSVRRKNGGIIMYPNYVTYPVVRLSDWFTL